MPNKEQSNLQKFNDAEGLWFWFISSKRIQTGLRRTDNPSGRVCELIDIETLITKLHLSGRLSREQLDVLVEFGMRRRTPHQHIYAENRAALLWRDAMNIIQIAVSTKGWIA
ncbi:MAG: hypothetical protein FWC83_01265 [Alphaproteobacteria bacterium]|nr:hypothetical protein [Alphaproteobacteria bacterium]